MNRSKILVSVIMPVYNSGNYLRKAVNSILSQSFTEFELILVDDGSTDGSSEKCDLFAKKDCRVIVLHQQNRGICNARNEALSIAKGEYIAFSDHDDEYLPELLEDSYKLAKQNNADVVKFCSNSILLEGENILKNNKSHFGNKVYNKRSLIENYFNLLHNEVFTCVWDGLYKRSLIAENNLYFDESYKSGGEDIDFMSRIVCHINTLITTSNIYYNHYIRKGYSTSTKLNLGVIEQWKQILISTNRTIVNLEINILDFKTDYSYFLIKNYLSPIIAIYAHPGNKIPNDIIIKEIRLLTVNEFVYDWCLNISTFSIFKKSKKYGLAYWLYKNHQFSILLKLFKSRT